MQWAEMSPDQRDLLVATKIMKWQPRPCNEDDLTIYDDGLMFCANCRERDHLSDFEHREPKPPRYTQSIDLAIQVMQRVPGMTLFWNGVSFECSLRTPELGLILAGGGPAESICLVALKAS